MNIPMIFVAIITCLLALYMMNRFIRRPGVFSAFLLLIQLLTASVSFFSILENVLTTPVFELSVIIAGVILPMPVIVYDHYAAYKRMEKKGVKMPFIESRGKKVKERWSVSAFTESAELWKETIHATDVFRSLSINDPAIRDNIKKQLVLIQRLINLELYEKAAEQYRFLFAIIPFSALIAYNTGYLYCFVGKYRDAYKILLRALRMNKNKEPQKGPDDAEKSFKNYNAGDLDAMIRFNMGFALYNMKKYEHAIRHFLKVTEHKPDLAVAYKNIARSYLKINMGEKAIEYLEKGRLDLRDVKMRIVLGSIYYSKGDTKKVLEVLDEAAGSGNKHIEGLLWKGKAAIKEKEYGKAIECFNALINAEPEDPRHYYHLALAQRSAGDKDGALKTYEKGINVSPANSLLLYNMGTLLDEAGEKEKAVQVLYKSLQGDEMLEDAFNCLGVLLGQLKRYRESVQVFDKGIHLYQNSYQLFFNRGIVLGLARRLEDAADSYEKAYELNKTDPMLIYYYTATLMKLREYSRAIRIYKAGLSYYPDDAELVYGLSKVYTHMGEKDAAVELLKKAAELDPSYLARIRKDADFKTLYRHEGYKSLLVS